MISLKNIAAAGLLSAGLALSPLAAQAQTTAAPAATAAGYGFDGYRVLAVTAGVIGGAMVAVIVTDGLIIPIYAMATGAEAAGFGMAGGMAAGAGAGAGEMAVANGMAESMYGPMGHAGYHALRSVMAVLGAVGGGFYADSWYLGG